MTKQSWLFAELDELIDCDFGKEETTMTELDTCPFCGGSAKISFKDYEYGGQNAFGDKKRKYRLQAICNKCKSRGKPIITDWLINPNPYITSCWRGKGRGNENADLMFAAYIERVIEAWNRRVNDERVIR